jgi:hypothetical protein
LTTELIELPTAVSNVPLRETSNFRTVVLVAFRISPSTSTFSGGVRDVLLRPPPLEPHELDFRVEMYGVPATFCDRNSREDVGIASQSVQARKFSDIGTVRSRSLPRIRRMTNSGPILVHVTLEWR